MVNHIAMAKEIPDWKVSGDWFDVCKCSIPCPCTYAQAPSYGDCDGVLAYHIKSGHFGSTSLDGLNVLGIGYFKGNIWAGEAKATIGLFFDEKANPQQREALQMIFSGKAGGFMAEFAKLIQDVRGIEYAQIRFEVSDDLSSWSAEIPGKVVARAEALSGPMTPPGKRVQTINAPGSETGPGTTATWGRAIANEVDAMGFKWEWNGRSSKHIPFDWSGP
ncbi:MAG TPA: DUF1326 domain-containing protein [Nitrososphaeraceae archaeon]|nr:DUF1326 domain-containing protein [Nitrososphaeraceae archaeon]